MKVRSGGWEGPRAGWVHFERPKRHPPKCWSSALEPRGQLGAAKDSLALETRTLTRESSFSGAWARRARKQAEAACPGSRDLCRAGTAPAHIAATTLALPDPSDAAAGHSLGAGFPAPLHSQSPKVESRRAGLLSARNCTTTEPQAQHVQPGHGGGRARGPHSSAADSPFPQRKGAQTPAHQQPGPAGSHKPRFVFSITRALIENSAPEAPPARGGRH